MLEDDEDELEERRSGDLLLSFFPPPISSPPPRLARSNSAPLLHSALTLSSSSPSSSSVRSSYVNPRSLADMNISRSSRSLKWLKEERKIKSPLLQFQKTPRIRAHTMTSLPSAILKPRRSGSVTDDSANLLRDALLGTSALQLALEEWETSASPRDSLSESQS
jgi:hypothetical protein